MNGNFRRVFAAARRKQRRVPADLSSYVANLLERRLYNIVLRTGLFYFSRG